MYSFAKPLKTSTACDLNARLYGAAGKPVSTAKGRSKCPYSRQRVDNCDVTLQHHTATSIGNDAQARMINPTESRPNPTHPPSHLAIVLVWPSSFPTSAPVATSHNRMLLSSEPETTCLPSGENATLRIVCHVFIRKAAKDVHT